MAPASAASGHAHVSDATAGSQEKTSDGDRHADHEATKQRFVGQLSDHGSDNTTNQQQSWDRTQLDQVGRQSKQPGRVMPAGVSKLATDENAHIPLVAVLDRFNAQEH